MSLSCILGWSSPPPGTRCFLRNEALGLEGWGVLLPLPPDEEEYADIFAFWEGELSGPTGAEQLLLKKAGFESMTPGFGRMMVTKNLLFVEQAVMDQLVRQPLHLPRKER